MIFPFEGAVVVATNHLQACHVVSVPAREAKRKARNLTVPEKNDARKMARKTVKT